MPHEVDSEALRPLLVSATEAAQLLGVSRTKIYYLTRDGDLPAVRIGRAIRYSVSAMEEFVRGRSRTTLPVQRDSGAVP